MKETERERESKREREKESKRERVSEAREKEQAKEGAVSSIQARMRGRTERKANSAKAKKRPWIAAIAAAKKALNLCGFVKIKKGTPLYRKAKALYKQSQKKAKALDKK